MRLCDFVRQNRDELTEAVGRNLSHVPRTASCSCPRSGTDHHHEQPNLTLKELEDWVMNDEGLYNWARREGCKI